MQAAPAPAKPLSPDGLEKLLANAKRLMTPMQYLAALLALQATFEVEHMEASGWAAQESTRHDTRPTFDEVNAIFPGPVREGASQGQPGLEYSEQPPAPHTETPMTLQATMNTQNLSAVAMRLADYKVRDVLAEYLMQAIREARDNEVKVDQYMLGEALQAWAEKHQ